MSLAQYLLFFCLVALATFCQNLTGFAFGLILVGLAGATQLMPIADAANVACLLSLVNGVAYLRNHPFSPQWRLLRPMLASSVVGVAGGLVLLSWLSGHALNGLRLLLGVAIVGCAVALLLQKQVRTQMSGPASLWGAGVLSGLLGGLFATPGPPMVYHLYRQPLDRLLVRQCLFVIFITCTVLRLGVVVATGDLRWELVLVAALAFPVVTLVTWLHARHPPALPQRLVEWLVCLLLMLAGGSMLAPAL
ncbi:TSUP family transporter [Acidovorax sp. SRB_24]|uniref:TSUP family transporter n=1 Tax=Acidovorax sp. SRB_24 TaxID=1962700 RepID=UPI00145FAC26|nr:TSUP family transporter [Acidovorax sp. SRB_24]NMM77896.1 hypothetical protein [Acidovorax sp. SRB_24]